MLKHLIAHPLYDYHIWYEIKKIVGYCRHYELDKKKCPRCLHTRTEMKLQKNKTYFCKSCFQIFREGDPWLVTISKVRDCPICKFEKVCDMCHVSWDDQTAGCRKCIDKIRNGTMHQCSVCRKFCLNVWNGGRCERCRFGNQNSPQYE